MVSRVFDRKLRRGNNGPVEPIRAEIPENEVVILAEFMRHVETMFSSTLMREISLNFKLEWDLETGFGVSGKIPDDDVIAVMLHRMRPFVLQKESTYLPKVCNVLSRYITHDGFRNVMKAIIGDFLGHRFQGQLRIDVDGTVLNTDSMLNKWLNACEYHHADDARQELYQFKAVLPESWQRCVFISMMVDKARQVGNTSIVVRWLHASDADAWVLNLA